MMGETKGIRETRKQSASMRMLSGMGRSGFRETRRKEIAEVG
jgi:hypothetical protein